MLIEIPGETSSEEVNQRTANIKQASGKLAMVIVPDEVSGKILAAAGEETGSVPALPTLFGYGPTAQRFAALGKKGNAQAACASQPLPNQRYELAYGVQQQRTEYFTPGTWELRSHGYWGQLDSLTETLRLEAGHSYQLAWNKAVTGPTLRGTTRTPQEGAPGHGRGARMARLT